MIKELELPGLPFIERLLEEAECELWQSAEDPKASYRWTFMYNDSVESYVLLEDVSITGEYQREELYVDLRLHQTENRMGISGRRQQMANRTIQKVWKKFLEKPTVKREKAMAHLLGTKKGIGIYQTLRKQIIKASSIYGSRDFGEKANLEIVEKRKELEKMLWNKGWKGSYPDFQRTKGFYYKQIHFVEEQPFTTEEFQYVFHGMVSFCGWLHFRKMKKQLGTDADGRLPVNFGFFKGCGKGKILRFPISIKNLD